VKITSAEQAVGIAAEKSIEASLQSTFAVGGAIINNRSGSVICALHNNVLEPYETRKFFLLHDPTAHGERQLVDWYFKHRSRRSLPPPQELTIVTTLDPCAMCAGAILTAGFNVAVSALDDYAGINFDGSFDFPSLPQRWKKAAKATFAYYGVDAPVRRSFRGSKSVIFANQSIRAATYFLTDTIFESSVNSVRLLDNNSGKDPANLSNPAKLSRHSPIRMAFNDACPEAFSVTCATPRMPGKELAKLLVDVASRGHRRGAALNSVAFLDPFGNLLLCVAGAEHHSPTRTAFMQLTRSYAHIRWVLMNSSNASVRDQSGNVLTHPKFGTFVFLYLPDPDTPQGLMALGAYGSTMEGPIPQSYPSNLQYVLLPEGTTNANVARRAMSLPPFYTKGVQVDPTQVLDAALIEEVVRLLPPDISRYSTT
jgi:tRNA(Arg) A34 adenosine deaminase TadA